jgi:hypothetical protein
MDPDLPVAVFVFVACAALPFACTIIVDKCCRMWSSRSKGLLAGILPSLIVVFVLAILHFQARAQYATGPQDGFMSPLALVIYGFPLFVVYLIFSFAIAHREKHPK